MQKFTYLPESPSRKAARADRDERLLDLVTLYLLVLRRVQESQDPLARVAETVEGERERDESDESADDKERDVRPSSAGGNVDRERREDDDAKRPEIRLREENYSGTSKNKKEPAEHPLERLKFRAYSGEIRRRKNNCCGFQEFSRLDRKIGDQEPATTPAVLKSELGYEHRCRQKECEDKEMRREATPQAIRYARCDEKRGCSASNAECKVREDHRVHVRGASREESENGRRENEYAAKDKDSNEDGKRPVDASVLHVLEIVSEHSEHRSYYTRPNFPRST